MKRSKVEFSSHTANLALLRNCVRDFLNGYPFSEKERMFMVLGVDEACTNVIRYAYRLREDRVISLRMEGLRKMRAHALAGLWRENFPARNDRSVARPDQTGRAWPSLDSLRV